MTTETQTRKEKNQVFINDVAKRYQECQHEPGILYGDSMYEYLRQDKEFRGDSLDLRCLTEPEIKQISRGLCRTMGYSLRDSLGISEEDFDELISQKTHSGKGTSLGLIVHGFTGFEKGKLSNDLLVLQQGLQKKNKYLDARIMDPILRKQFALYLKRIENSSIADVLETNENDEFVYLGAMRQYVKDNAKEAKDPKKYEISAKAEGGEVLKKYISLLEELYSEAKTGEVDEDAL